MKKLTLLLGSLLLGATSLLAQYAVSFSANVALDSVQVKNTVSGEAKILYSPDNVITLQKVENQNVAVATVGNSTFMQQTANNTVAVNVETALQLNLTLYSVKGTMVSRYANNVNAGQYSFQVGASAGVYVLVASANGQTASLKLSLRENAQTGIFEVAAAEPVAFLKSADDVITFNEGETFEFTGYYKEQTDVKTEIISENKEIVFEFEEEKSIIENGSIKAAFSVSAHKQVYFSQGNLQYQASTETWKFADNQYDMIGNDNANISENYEGWIDLFGWGTSGYNSKYPYMTSRTVHDYGDSLNHIAGTNYDWGVHNKISNGGNQAGLWRTLTIFEWVYLIETRTDASDKKGVASVNGLNGLILLPDEWTLPEGIVFTSGVANQKGCEYYATINSYTASEWSKMEANGAVFLPAAGYRDGTNVYFVGTYGYYWSATTLEYPYANYSGFGSGNASICVSPRKDGQSVRLVQDVE